MTFYQWVFRHRHATSPLGDLARDILADTRFPQQALHAPEVLRHLVESGASESCWEAALDGFRRFRRELRPRLTRRRARNAGPRMRAEVLERDGFRCRRCGADARSERLVVDHIRPFSDGGLTVLDNLQTLCFSCNAGKGNRSPHAHDLAFGAT